MKMDTKNIWDILRTAWIRDAASCATHYEWRRGDCPYDTSGELKDCGDIDLNISIADFLEEEYTGGTKATYVSGHGLSYETYQDSLTNDTITLCENVLRDAVRICLQEAFPEDEVSERDAMMTFMIIVRQKVFGHAAGLWNIAG